MRFLVPRKRYVFVVSNDGLVLAHVVGGEVLRHWSVRGSEEASYEFVRETLAEEPHTPVITLIDLPEQIFRVDTVPPVYLFDRPKALRRKLDHVFPVHEVKAALNLRERVGSRRDHRYLFAALPASPVLDRWVGVLDSGANPVIGPVLLPLESADMASALARASAAEAKGAAPRPWAILITPNRSGFRQVVVHKGRFVLTRLTTGPKGDDDPNILAQKIERELSASLTYLIRLGYTTTEGLDLILIGSHALRDALASRNLPVQRLAVLTLGEARNLLGMSPIAKTDGDCADLLHAAWVAKKAKPVLKLQRPEWNRQEQQVAIRRAAIVALSVPAFLLAIFSGYSAVDLHFAKQELAPLSAERNLLSDRLDLEIQTAGQYPAPAKTVADTLEIYQRLVDGSVDPQPIIAAVGDSLGKDLRLKSLLWTAKIAPEPQRRIGASTNREEEKPRPHFEIILVVDLSSVETAENAIDETNALAERLKERFVEHQVSVLRLPLSILPSDTFTGDSREKVSGKQQQQWFAEIGIQGPAL